MATPLDVVHKHRTHAWTFFALIVAGFLALCVGTTVWHAHQRRHPPVALEYSNDPVQLGDISICLTNEWGYFPVNLTGVQASCELGATFRVPNVRQLDSVVSLSGKPDQLSDLPIFQSGVSSFQANEAGCAISQSFRSGLLGAVPKNCFRFATGNINWAVNTSVTLALAFQSTTFTNSANASVATFQGQPGSQAVLALFTDGLNSLNGFEMSYQAINSSNSVQLEPSVRTNIKAFANGNHSETFANPSSTPFNFGAQAGAFLSGSNSFIQMIITTTPKGYLHIQEQDPLSALVLLSAYGGFWPYFLIAFEVFFVGEPSLGIRPFILRYSRAIWSRVRPAKAKPAKQPSTEPMTSAALDHAAEDMKVYEMPATAQKELAYMASIRNDKLPTVASV